MSFEPVFLPPGRELDGAVSMTFLRHHNLCRRSGFLYRKHGHRGVQTVEMVRGTVLHEVLARATQAMLDTGESAIPPELVKAIVNEVLEESPLPLEEHDYVREMAYRWAGEWRLREDEKVVAVERLFVLELAGWQVRCKVDFASRDERGALYVADYKSGRGAPNCDAISRKREDGPAGLAAKTFQLVVYVLALAFGHPIDRVVCTCCRGSGALPDVARPSVRAVQGRLLFQPESGCGECSGRGYQEIPGEQVARGCPEAICEYVYPAIEKGDGLMLRPTMGLTRLEMLEYRESLEGQLRQLSRRIETGDWPAVVSDEGCGECACPAECPIPAELRDHRGEINTRDEFVEALTRRHVVARQQRALGRELRVFSEKMLGGEPVRYGRRQAAVVPTESVEVTDRDGLIAALAGGMGEAEARERFVRVRQGTTFSDRDLTAGELEDDAA